MKVIVDIPQKAYEEICEVGSWSSGEDCYSYIYHGIKIDSDLLECEFKTREGDSYIILRKDHYNKLLSKAKIINDIRAEIEDYSDLTDIDSYKGKVLDIIDRHIKGEEDADSD